MSNNILYFLMLYFSFMTLKNFVKTQNKFSFDIKMFIMLLELLFMNFIVYIVFSGLRSIIDVTTR